ncbi:MAG TPA: HupE/UreJ family protein [Alphaproteobacteria bacterium]|nr:HupE/UreJ family protein [Alphaproteobacteria bacterium]
MKMRGDKARRSPCTGLLLALLLLLPVSAQAHTTGTGLATLSIDGRDIRYRLTLVLGEIAPPIRDVLHQAGNGDRRSAEKAAALLRRLVSLRIGSVPCEAGGVRLQASSLGEERLTLQTRFRCPDRVGDLVLSDHWPDVFGTHYRSIVDIRTAHAARQIVLDGEHPSVTVSHLDAETGWLSFLRLGVEHILTGYDHVLFVAALLIGSRTLLQVLSVVTAFTLAHSITLAVAVLGLAQVPAAIIEPLIAASIVVMALENLTTAESRWRWLVTFGFGLVHGFGFAGVLQQMALNAGALARALVGFNLGVEVGQAVVVLLLWPLLWLSQRRLKAFWSVRMPSAAIALCGAVWLFVRLA